MSLDGIPQPQRSWAHVAVAIGIAMAVLDGAIANVALPTMAAELHAEPSASIWIVNAYQLAVTISLLPLSSLGDRWGYKVVFCAGLALFTAASLACSLSHSLGELTIARAVQGLGAAGIMSVNNALIRFIYPHQLLGRGVSYNALIVAVSSVAGPTVAAAILSWSSWPWLFIVNVPLGALALVASFRLLPRTHRSDQPFDIPSAALNALMFGLLLFGIDTVADSSSRSIGVIELLGAVIVGVIFVRRQHSMAAPMLPLDLLRIPIFSLSMVTSICSFTAQSLAYVSLPFLFQTVMNHSQASTGALMTAWPLVVALVSPIAGRLSDRHSAGLLGPPSRTSSGGWPCVASASDCFSPQTTAPFSPALREIGAAARTACRRRPGWSAKCSDPRSLPSFSTWRMQMARASPSSSAEPSPLPRPWPAAYERLHPSHAANPIHGVILLCLSGFCP
jgi:DHA2 family multidrug resistance protein-like MFS transporter